MPPKLVRAHQAALILGSGQVLVDFVAAGWLQPVLSEHMLIVYSYRELEHCVAKLENGELPVPDGVCKKPKAPGLLEGKIYTPLSSRNFADQLRGMMTVPPLLLRPEQAATLLSSVELLDEMRKSGWVRPVYCKAHMTLFSVRDLEGCVTRLEAGQKPGDYADESPTVPRLQIPIVEAPVPVMKSSVRVYRKTRRPMPPGV